MLRPVGERRAKFRIYAAAGGRWCWSGQSAQPWLYVFAADFVPRCWDKLRARIRAAAAATQDSRRRPQRFAEDDAADWPLLPDAWGGCDLCVATGELAKAARVVGFGQLGRVVKSANLLVILIDSHIMANAANTANTFTTGRG